MVTNPAHVRRVFAPDVAWRRHMPVALFGVWWTLWLFIFRDAAYGAVAVWFENSTFHHGFLVVPFFAWVVHRDWHSYPCTAVRPNPLIIGVMGLAVIGWTAGFIGEVLVVQQLAAVALVPLAAVLVFGWRFAIAAWFPLTLLFFGIPLGEELIPQLQQTTAVLAVELLKLSGIPVWIDDVYVHVKAGVFHVAAACAGVKFLIASVFFGFVATYLQFERPAKRLSYMAFCLVAPVLANAVRVYVTILVGLWFGMEYVHGFDHVVYGWLLFALIFALIVWVALKYGDRPAGRRVETETHREPARKGAVAAAFLPLLAVAAINTWLAVSSAFSSDLERLSLQAEAPADWQPMFPGAAQQGFLITNVSGVDAYVAAFRGDEAQGELVTSANQLFDRGIWRLAARRRVAVDGVEAELTLLRSDGRGRAVLSWYELPDGSTLSSAARIKGQQVLNVLNGLGRGGRFVAVSTEVDDLAVRVPPQRLLEAAREMRAMKESGGATS